MELVSDVVGPVLVIVDLDLIQDVVVEGKVVRARSGLLAGNGVQDEGDSAVFRRASQVGRIVADEGIEVRDVGRRVISGASR